MGTHIVCTDGCADLLNTHLMCKNTSNVNDVYIYRLHRILAAENVSSFNTRSTFPVKYLK